MLRNSHSELIFLRKGSPTEKTSFQPLIVQEPYGGGVVMSIVELGALGEFLGAFAVVVTLAFRFANRGSWKWLQAFETRS